MLARRLQRDVKERGRSVDGILDQWVAFYETVCHWFYRAIRYLRFVKPSYDNFVRPTATYADIVCLFRVYHWTRNWEAQIVPGSNNTVAIELISAHIRRQLQQRANQFRQKLAIPHLYLNGRSGASTPESRLEDLDLQVLPQTPQLQVVLHISIKLFQLIEL